jgi:cytochrome bd-type quinol oxidase subunit 2
MSAAGPPRLLAGFYVLFAIAAGARSAYQLATRFDEAPVAYALSALAAAVYVLAAVALRTDRRRLLAAAVSVELIGVLAVGTLTLADRSAFPDETVWSHYGQGYGFLPLVLPVAALAWLLPAMCRYARLS